MKKKILVFTDLDGTLMDHYSYRTDEAEATISTLKFNHIPIIPNSSKTLPEVLTIREKLALHSPFIIENGAAIYIPLNYFQTQPVDTVLQGEFWVKSFSETKAHWLALLSEKAAQYRDAYQGFSQMSDVELATITGLSIEDAQMAKQRQFGEPLHWLGTDELKVEFIEHMQTLGVTLLEGGRFLHVSGHCDKGVAQAWLAEQYLSNNGLGVQNEPEALQVLTIALGDGKNDSAMLEQASIAVQIRSPVHDFPHLQRTNNLYQSKQVGPAGWAECLHDILAKELIS